MAHCSACDLDLEPDADRCPKCLRRSTVVDGREDDDEEQVAAPPAWAGPRALVAFASIGLGALFAWKIFEREAWLEAHHMWLAAILGSLGLVTMPLRVAFRLPSEATEARDALRFYALATLAADAFVLLFAGVTALTSLALGDSILALPVGLFAFFMLLAAAPVVVVAVRRPHELREALRQSGKAALLLAGVVVLGTMLVLLRAPSQEPKPLVIPEDPKALVDPFELDHVPLEKRTTRDADGATTRNLSADAGDIERTLLKLDVAAITAVNESKADPSASGFVRCWVPARLRTPENAARMAKEQAKTNETLANIGAKTLSGRAIQVAFDFGAPR